MKLSALTELQMMNEATSEAMCLLYGNRLPHPTDNVYRVMDTPLPNHTFNHAQTIAHLENLQVSSYHPTHNRI